MNQQIKSILSRWYALFKNLSTLHGVVYPKSTLLVGSELKGNISIGNNSKIFYSIINGDVRIGNYTSIWGPNISIEGNVEIGSFCSIARNVSIQESYHNYKRITNYLIWKNVFSEHSPNELQTKGKIVIGSDVWIGMNSSILSGVTIGHGAIVGANALVNTDVPAYAIFAGVPSKIIGYRFQKSIIEKLLRINWWDWPIDKIKKHKQIFENDLTSEMLEGIED